MRRDGLGRAKQCRNKTVVPKGSFGISVGRKGPNIFVSRLTAEVLVEKRTKILGRDGDLMLVLGLCRRCRSS